MTVTDLSAAAKKKAKKAKKAELTVTDLSAAAKKKAKKAKKAELTVTDLSAAAKKKAKKAKKAELTVDRPLGCCQEEGEEGQEGRTDRRHRPLGCRQEEGKEGKEGRTDPVPDRCLIASTDRLDRNGRTFVRPFSFQAIARQAFKLRPPSNPAHPDA